MMVNFLIAEDNQLWNIILDGSTIPIKLDTGGTEVHKEISEFSDIDRKLIEKNAKAKKDTIWLEP